MRQISDSGGRIRDPERTRERILDAAQGLILDRGFGATTVDAIVGRAGITKGAFFHHFASKTQLAHHLAERYAAADREHFDQLRERARKLSSDPLQQVLLLIGFYEEEFDSMEELFAGCLFASYIYENELFDAKTIDVLRETILMWRRVMREMLDKAAAAHPPRIPVDMDSLSDLFYAVTQGAFIMTKTLADQKLLGQQARHLRNYLELLFAPDVTPPSKS